MTDATATAAGLGAQFPPVSIEQWLAEAAPGATEIPGTLVEDGVEARWLYVRDPDGGAERPVRAQTPPGAGGRAGWDIRQEHSLGDAARARRDILADLAGGVTSIVLRIDDDSAFGLDGLDAVLEDVLLDLAPIALDAGPRTLAATALLAALWARRGHDPSAIAGSLRVDPIGTLAHEGELPGDPLEAVAAAAALAAEVHRRWPQVRALGVDTRAYADAGATASLELALAIATGVAYLRAADEAGLAPVDAASQIEFTVSVGPDQFLEIAKLRALRRVWARVLEACGVVPERRHSAVIARTAWRTFSAVDPWVNMLRATTAAFAAATAGADGITVTPFDAPLGAPGELGRRIARNTQLILQEESSLARVADPAGGSWYVESLTGELAQAAWSQMQHLERRGGALASLLDGTSAALIEGPALRFEREVARRQRLLTGVNAFPLLDERLPDLSPAAAPRPGRRQASADPLRDIVRALGQSRAKDLAIDAAAAGELRTMPDDRLRSEAAHLRSILETAPTRAAHEIDALTSERSRVSAEVQLSAQTLERASAQLADARWRDRRILRERVAGANRAADTWRHRLADVDERIAQVRERLGDPDAWLDDRRDAIGRLVAVETEAARRAHLKRTEALRLVTIDPPAYVTQELGPRPEQPTLQRRWDQGARTIESYRQRHGHHLAPDQPGLGPPPRVDRERRAYHAATRRLDAVKTDLGRQPPTRGPVALDRGR